MDKIILKSLIDKWQGSLQYLKSHQADLSPEEWSAIEVLQDLWRNRSFSPDMTREANEMIDVLINCDKFHSNNREIITKSKDFRAVAKKFYTESSETFNEIRNAIQPPRRPQTPKPVQTPPTPSPSPDDQALSPGIIMTYIRDWHRGMVYLFNHQDELDDSEAEAIAQMRDNWTAPARPAAMAQIESASNKLREGTRLHNSNRDIITNSKYVTGAARKYNANPRLHEGFARKLAEFLRQNPLPTSTFSGGLPIRVTGITIGEHDSSGNWVRSTFYTDLTYLYVRVHYDRLNPRCRAVDLGIKFIRPDGTLDPNSSTPGFSLRDQNMPVSASGFLEISGWGNKNGFGFSKGTWKVEIWINGEITATTSFTMRERVSASTPPPPPPPPPALRVTSVTFTSARQSKLSASTSTSFTPGQAYITPIVSYTTLRPGVSVTLYYKIFTPDGRQLDPSEGPNGYTWKGSFTTAAGGGRAALGGFGHDNGNTYRTPGRYRVEIYLDDRLVNTSYFTVSSATRPISTPTPTPTYTPTGGSRGGGRKSRAWMWILAIILIVGGYFGVTAYLDKRADDAATVMYALSDAELLGKPGSEPFTASHSLRESDRVLVYDIDDAGWAHIKTPAGHKGYVNINQLATPEDNELLSVVTGGKPNSSLDQPHKRAALLHLLRSGKLNEEWLRDWRLNDPGAEVLPNTVRYVRLNDGTDPDLKTLFLKLENPKTRESKIAIYAFPSDSASRPVLRYFADAPAGKEISQVSYSPRNGYYSVNYSAADKHLSSHSKPDSDNPFIITGLQFVNINNSRNLISNTVTQSAQFVAPKVTYQNTSDYNGRNIQLDIKLFDNHTGDLLHSSDSPGGEYTYSTSLRTGYKGRGTETLDGWGSSKKTSWRGGVSRRYEIYYRGQLLASGTVAP